MAENGGARPGAGRKAGGMNQETRIRLEMRKRWLESVNARADEIFQTYADLAFGVKVVEKTPDGEIKIYTTKPDRAALEWMMEQVWGKAKIKVDLEVTDKTTVITELLKFIAHENIYGKDDDEILQLVESGEPDDSGRLFIQPEDKQTDVPTAESAPERGVASA